MFKQPSASPTPPPALSLHRIIGRAEVNEKGLRRSHVFIARDAKKSGIAP
jgi:hypothetical protein